MLTTGTLNTMIERVAYRPLRNAPKLAPLITAVGFSFILQNVGQLWQGASQRSIPDIINSGATVVTIFGVEIERKDVLAVGVTIPLVLLLTAFITKSRLGKAMRATAQDPEAARLMGINVNTTISATFLLGGLLAGAAGLIYALYQTNLWYFQGFQAGLIAFTAAVMGGIGNLKGAVLGGFIIGIISRDHDQPNRQRLGARGRLLVPHHDHGVPPARAARRGDEGGRMTVEAPPRKPAGQPGGVGGVLESWRRLRRMRYFGLVAGVIAITLAALIPVTFFGSTSKELDVAIYAVTYVMFALGLNVVVGFAGLLDLGYVAFYAVGAYTVGWFASDHFSAVNGGQAHQLRRRVVPRPRASISTSC